MELVDVLLALGLTAIVAGAAVAFGAAAALVAAGVALVAVWALLHLDRGDVQ